MGSFIRLLSLAALAITGKCQLMGYAPWPMRGRNAIHAANGLVAAPNNSVAVVKFAIGSRAIRSSPAVGADGTVYVGSIDNKTYALNADGSLKWSYATGGGISSSPAVGADGTVLVGSADGFLHVLGLSAGHVTSSLHLAQRRLACNESALPQLTRLCDFTSVIHFEPQCNASVGCNVCDACCKVSIPAGQCAACFHESCPARTDTFTPETVDLVNKSCQILRNYNASAPYLKAWEGFVDPLSFTEYQGLISTGGTMMTLLQSYESKLADFQKAETTNDARIAAANDAVAGYAADETSWQAHISSDTEAMSSYGNEVVTLGRQMDTKYALVQDDVHSLIDSLNAKLNDLSKQLKAAKKKDEARKRWSLFGFLMHLVKAVISIVSCFAETAATGGAALLSCGEQCGDDIMGVVDSATGCIETFRSSCKPCKELAAEMQEAHEAEDEINALAGMAKAAQALNDQLTTGAPLPQELPILISDKIAMDSLRTSADAFKQELVKEGGSQFVSDIDDWTDMGINRVSLFLSYYNLATRVQNDNASLAALRARTSIVQARLADEEKQEAAIVTAAQLVLEKQQKQVRRLLSPNFPHSVTQTARPHPSCAHNSPAGDARHQVPA